MAAVPALDEEVTLLWFVGPPFIEDEPLGVTEDSYGIDLAALPYIQVVPRFGIIRIVRHCATAALSVASRSACPCPPAAWLEC